MVENLVNVFLDLFNGLDKNLIIFLISCMPILELRGGLIAATLLGLDPISSFIICFLGNILPIPFILKFITPLFDKLKKTKRLNKIVTKLEAKADSKRDKIEKSEFIGLLLFVGIPLPGTGAWTGNLIACMINMDKKKAFIASTLGVLLAGIIMMIVSYGLIGSLI
ncbi:MAG: small multi-drug export protein [Lactobacillales bacterium]|nr:small multi-drug export protein [Lactobacillales bacterium]